jgi:hypothetical protein
MSQPEAIRGVEVPVVVQPKPWNAGGRGRTAPAVADGVLVRGLAGFSSKAPAAFRAVCRDVGRRHLDQLGRQEHDPLAAVLRRADLDRAAGSPLYLAGDGEGAAQEVDVLDSEAGGLPESEARERAECDERAEGSVGGLEDGSDLGRCGQGHCGLGAPATGECDPNAGIAGDVLVRDGAAEDGPARCSSGCPRCPARVRG